MSDTPKVMRAFQWSATLGPAVTTTVIPLLWAALVGTPKSFLASLPALSLTGVVTGLFMFITVRAGRRLVKTVVAAQGFVCIDCGYSLQELQSPRACPECGLAVPPDRHASVWKELGFPVK